MFEVLVRPGQRLEDALQPGDVLLRRVPGEPDAGHLAVIVGERSWQYDELAGAGLRAEPRGPGIYVSVVEGGASPRGLTARQARLVAGTGGVVPANQMVLRPVHLSPLPVIFEQPATAPAKPFVVLDRFVVNRAVVPARHNSVLKRIAHLIVDSQGGPDPIKSIRLVGHADSTGPTQRNQELGLERADAVIKALKREIDALSSGLSSSITFTPESQGEGNPVASNATDAGRAANRRVEAFIPTTCQSFFAQYDLRFLPGDAVFGIPAHPNLDDATKRQRTADVGGLVGELTTRRDRRASDALAGNTTPANSLASSSPLFARARRLSTSQLDLYREYLGDGVGGIDFARFQGCFEQFANGELRSSQTANQRKGIGEPNGGFFFFFAEFAFLAIDSGLDSADWTQALRVFLLCQELFMHVYRPAPALSAAPAVPTAPPAAGSRVRNLDETRTSTGAIRPGFANRHFNAAAQSDATRKTALRSIYAPLDLNAMRDAARDNMLRALRLP
jgi:hypothetical protein